MFITKLNSLLLLGAAATTLFTASLATAQVVDTSNSVTTIESNELAVALNQNYYSYTPPSPRVYRYPYRYYRVVRPRVYYSAPAYRYPRYVYPRTPQMMYYGPAVRVTYGPWVSTR